MTRKFIRALLVCLSIFNACDTFADPPEGRGNWKLVFEENFNCTRDELFETWVSAYGNVGHILSGRFPENVEVKNGIMSLRNRKEKRGTQEWTSGSINTFKYFKYGYFECRYKYADAPGVNNSFWLMDGGNLSKGFKPFELDINEGHYPDELNCTVHDWTPIKQKDGTTRHKVIATKCISLDPGSAANSKALVSIPLDVSVPVKKLRLSTNYYTHFHLKSLAAFPKNSLGGYPELDERNMRYLDENSPKNLLADGEATASGCLEGKEQFFGADNALDGDLSTGWCSNSKGEKWIEVTLPEAREIGCVQFISGWVSNGKFIESLPTYKVEYFDGSEWKTLKERSTRDVMRDKSVNLARSWNTYGLLWTPTEFVFYFNGKEIMRAPNDNLANNYAPIFLSAAITNWAHGVCDEIDGTSMDVDYVKVWQDEKMGGGIVDRKPKKKTSKSPEK